MNFLSVEIVEALHFESIQSHGGSHGLRDRGLLESAVHRARNKSLYEEDASVAELAATIAWGLIKNHAFIDGNKRVGYGALGAFLRGNGYDLGGPLEERLEMVRRAAAGEITEEQWTVWVMRTAVPLG